MRNGNNKNALMLLAAWLLAQAGAANAAGFALIEQSGSGMGNAYAGAAATAEDASTIFFNPAGMTYLPDSQLVVALHAIRPSAGFSNNDSRGVLGTALDTGNGGDAGGWAFLPNLYFTKALNDSFRLGIGLNAPFGLKTEYDDGWTGRYHALKSELKTININPALAFKVNDNVSLGAGVNYQRVSAELSKAVDFGSVCVAKAAPFVGGVPAALATCGGAGLTPTGSDGKSAFEGDDWSWGFNLGAMIQAAPSTRIGLAYRSEIRHKLEGHATILGEEAFNALPGALAALKAALIGNFQDSDVEAKLDMPATFSASIFHRVNDKLDLMADATWTGWNSFETLRVVRTSGTLSGATLDVQPENWENTMRYSVGASYRYNDSLKLRAGIAYDESPVSDKWLTARIPDNNRTWLSLGANYRISQSSALDIGYTHLFVQDRSINTSAQAAEIAALGGSSAAGTLKGDYDSDVNILNVQYTHNF